MAKKNTDVRLLDGTRILRKTAQELRSLCRRFREETAIKRAAIGGEQDSGFEQSFASLAYTYVQDKAPALLDYLVGFQLVDRNEENTKAVGIFGFKAGNDWLYAPVFFINGDLKGHELLYLKRQNAFVPLKENWINYVLNRRPHILGEESSQSAEQLGIRQPDIRRLSQLPLYKLSHIKPWFRDSGVISKVASWVTQSPPAQPASLNFETFIQQDVHLCKLAVDMCDSFPGIRQAIEHFYPGSLQRSLLALRKQAAIQDAPAFKTASESNKRLGKRPANILKSAAAETPAKMELLTDETITDNVSDLSDAEKQRLLRDGYLVRDHRTGDEVTVAYNTQISMSLTNPTETGIYEVLTKPGEFVRCLVILSPRGGNHRRYGFSSVVRLDGEKNWDNYHPLRLFIKEAPQNSKSAKSNWQDWYDALPAGKSPTVGAKYLLVTANGQGSCPFEVSKSLGDDTWEVSWDDYISYSNRGDDHNSGYQASSDVPTVPMDDGDRIYFNKREGSSFRTVNGTLYCPEACKLFKLQDAPKCLECDCSRDDCDCDYFHYPREQDASPLLPGSLADLQLQLVQKQAEAALGGSRELGEMRIWFDGNEAIVNRQRMAKKAALFHLIRDHGLRERDAKTMLKLAEAAKHNGGRWLLKYAGPMDGMLGPWATGEGGPTASLQGMEPQISTDMNYGPVQTQMPSYGANLVQGMGYDPNYSEVYNPMQNIDPQSMQVAQQAASQGQKEVFDTAMISSMLKAVRQDSLVDRYLGDLTNALDKLGRILFMFYWHNEEFMDRYGKQDLPELEDTLRNSFETLGDLVLFLRQKTVDPFGTAGRLGQTDLGAAAAT